MLGLGVSILPPPPFLLQQKTYDPASGRSRIGSRHGSAFGVVHRTEVVKIQAGGFAVIAWVMQGHIGLVDVVSDRMAIPENVAFEGIRVQPVIFLLRVVVRKHPLDLVCHLCPFGRPFVEADMAPEKESLGVSKVHVDSPGPGHTFEVLHRCCAARAEVERKLEPGVPTGRPYPFDRGELQHFPLVVFLWTPFAANRGSALCAICIVLGLAATTKEAKP